MAAYLLLWNPDVLPHSGILSLLDKLGSGADATVEVRWRFSAHRQARAGDDAFLLKSGARPRGIFGRGVLQGSPLPGEGLDEGHKVFNVRFHALTDPNVRFLVDETELNAIPGGLRRAPAGGLSTRK